ncbi:unnamed protein product [Schistosoma mattheei]|uniref:Uncharacterized protein n=1 Tax=Schistosoma mattheei TaxID=31246 RepID=A0A3P8AMD8_9TREM|nr:unnamed protein product [Schistosoma mattheei]
MHDSTVTRPDPKSTVRALAQAIYLQIKHRNHKIACDPMIEIFDESLHPIQNRFTYPILKLAEVVKYIPSYFSSVGQW